MQIDPAEWSHFLSTATGVLLGSTPGASAVILFIYRAMRKLDVYLIEHEMLVIEYARSKNIEVEHLPTRTGRFKH